MDQLEAADQSTVYFAPQRGVKVRLIIACIFGVALCLVSGPWIHKFFSLLFFTLTVGSYINVRLCESRIERQIVIGFIPVRVRRWSLEKFHAIETGTSDDEPLGGLFALLFFRFWLFKIVVDAVFPWMGGELKLWLRGKRGGRVLAWEGNSNSQFEYNRNLLEGRLGLPVQRR